MHNIGSSSCSVESTKLEHECKGPFKTRFRGYGAVKRGPYKAMLEHGCSMVSAGVPSKFGLALQTFQLSGFHYRQAASKVHGRGLNIYPYRVEGCFEVHC